MKNKQNKKQKQKLVGSIFKDPCIWYRLYPRTLHYIARTHTRKRKKGRKKGKENEL